MSARSLRLRRRLRAAGLAGAVACALGFVWVEAGTVAGARSAPAVRAEAGAAQVAAPAAPRSAPTGTRAVPLLEHDAVRAHVAREDFHARARAFFDGSGVTTAEARARDAARLVEDVDRYEAARELSAGEALVMRIELIRATVADPLAQAERIAELQERYREDGERRMREYTASPPAAFVAYKQRERAIVDEVMALHAIPGGVDRDEYLRQRLQAEREALETP